MNEERLSLKNILFTKAIPNITIPFSTTGYKIFPCTDCGDKFLFQSSYDNHATRKSFKITYLCRHCGATKIFFNRCNLLAHIRSHSFKTATINISDLKIELLPLSTSTEKNISKTSVEQNISKATVEQNISKATVEQNISKATVEQNISKAIVEQTISNATVEQNISKAPVEIIKQNDKQVCFECKTDITCTGVMCTDRAKHYMQCSDTNTCYTCPVCLFSLPTSCALMAHLRIHLKKIPIICPECGLNLKRNTVNYPYSHDCEGFNMIRATTRLKCFDNKCVLFHPSKYREHMTSHVRKVYKCPICFFKWFDTPPGAKHTLCNNSNVNIVCYFKCPLCPNKLLTKSQINKHLNYHFDNTAGTELQTQVFPCRACEDVYKDVTLLIHHTVKKHDAYKSILDCVLLIHHEKSKGIYKVIKKCEKCQRSFIYRCKFENITKLPNVCPYNCSLTSNTNEVIQRSRILCFICKIKINSNWMDIKRHFAKFHTNIKCVDVKIELKKIDGNALNEENKNRKKSSSSKRKITPDKRRSKICKKLLSDKVDSLKTCDTEMISDGNMNNKVCYPEPDRESNTTCHATIASNNESLDKIICNNCGLGFDNKELLETHMIKHRDPCTAYQCLECGKCFVGKPSFSTHLLLEHEIDNVQEYIDKKDCFNELALKKSQKKTEAPIEPVEKNQCVICRDKFPDHETLEKHFRVHGMAFLLKNKQSEK